MASRTSGPPPKPLTVPVAVFSVVAAIVLTWLRAPGALGLYLGLLTAAIMMVPPLLTGKPGPDGIATPQGGGEEAQLTQYRKWNAIRRFLAPSAAWVPLPVSTGAITAVGAGLMVAVLPVDLQHELVPADLREAIPVEWLPLVNAISAFVVVHALAVAGRNADPTSEPRPAVGFGEVMRQVQSRGWGLLIVLAFLLVISAGAGVMVWLFAAQLPEEAAEWVLYPAALGAGVSLLLLAGLTHMMFAPAALLPWQQRVEARQLWTPRWGALTRLPEAPSLTKHERFGETGSWHADTFTLPGSVGGAQKAIALFEQMEHAFGAGTRAVFTSAPVVGQDGTPQQGTRDPNLMAAYTWPVAEPISLSAPGADLQQVLMLVQASIHQAQRSTKIKAPAPIVESVAALHAEDSEGALWAATLSLPEDTGGKLAEMLVELRAAGLDALIADGDPQVAVMQDDTDLIIGVFAESTKLADPKTGERLAFIGVQDYWRGRWDATDRMRAHPRLMEHRVYGPDSQWHVDVFESPAGVGNTISFAKGLPSTVPPDVNGRQTIFQSTPRLDAAGNELPGTRDLGRFAAYTWQEGSGPDIADPDADQELMQVWLQAMLQYAVYEAGAGAGPPIVLGITPLHDPNAESTTAAWEAQLVQPDVGVELNDETFGWMFSMGGLGSMVTGDNPELSVLNLGPNLVFGRFDEATVFAQESRRAEIQGHYESQEWQRVWVHAGARQAPFADLRSKSTASLPDGKQVHRITFNVPFGLPAADYLKVSGDKIKTAMNPLTHQLAALPVLARSSSMQADRDDSRLSLVWSHAPIATSPKLVRPDPEPEPRTERGSLGRLARENARTAMSAGRGRGMRNVAQKMVLEIAVTQAFDQVKLERPVVLRVQPLTKSSSREHLWDVELRLFGKLTIQDLRDGKAHHALKSALSASYLRVAPTMDGNARLVMGSEPSELTEFISPREESMLIQLDWEQAFQDAKVLQDGVAPKLADVSLLPKNQRVQRLVFDLPSGMHPEKFKASRDKLRGARHMDFIDITPGPQPGQMTVLCSPEDPLRSPMLFDWDAVHSSGKIAFGSTVTGEPMEYDQKEDPHILVLGSSGSGKAQPLDAPIPVPVSEKFPTGWAQNSDLDVGDVVFTPGSQETRVTSFSTTRDEPVFSVTTDDGQTTRVSGHHMWRVETAVSRGRRAFMHGATDAERARSLRTLAKQIGAEVGATPAQIGALSGVGVAELERSGALQPALIRQGLRAAGAGRATVFDTDAVLRHALSVAGSDGVFRFAGAQLNREDLLDLALEGTWLSAQSLADALLGREATAAEAELAAVLAQGLSAASREGTRRELVELYPVDEVLHLLARGYERSGLDEVIVTTESLADMIAAGQTVTVAAPAPVLGGEKFDPAVFASPLYPLPVRVRRGDLVSRRRLVKLWLSQADVLDDEHRVSFASRQIAVSAAEVLRSTGLWARLHGDTVAVRSAPLQVSGVVKGDAEPQRCLRTEDASHLYLTGGFVPTHNSAAMQAILTGAMINGFDAVVIDPMKGGVDFLYASEWIYGIAGDTIAGGVLMARVRDEIESRKALLKRHGASNTMDLPDDVRPRPLVVIIDEFQSLMAVGREPRMPSDTTDQSAMEEFDRASKEFEAKSTIAEVTGRIVREARSVQIMMLIGAQSLPVKLLDAMPNNSGSGLKSNMSRLLVGKTSEGERKSALKNPESAPQLGEVVPMGRGIFEGRGAAQLHQVWFDSETGDRNEHSASMKSQIASIRTPIRDEERWDVSQMVKKAAGSAEQFGAVLDDSAGVPELTVPDDIDSIAEVDLGDLDFSNFSFDGDSDAGTESSLDAEPEAVTADAVLEPEAVIADAVLEPEAPVSEPDDDVDWEALFSDDDELENEPEPAPQLVTEAELEPTPRREKPAGAAEDLFGGPKPAKIDDDIFGSF